MQVSKNNKKSMPTPIKNYFDIQSALFAFKDMWHRSIEMLIAQYLSKVPSSRFSVFANGDEDGFVSVKIWGSSSQKHICHQLQLLLGALDLDRIQVDQFFACLERLSDKEERGSCLPLGPLNSTKPPRSYRKVRIPPGLSVIPESDEVENRSFLQDGFLRSVSA